MRLPSNRVLVLTTVPGLVLAAAIVLIAQSGEDVGRQIRPRRALTAGTNATDVRAGGNLQVAINSAQCGEVISLQAGGTWDGKYILPNKSCTQSTPITIRSSDAASLPSGRVGVGDALHMPRIRALADGAAFQAAAGAGWWILDGLEITDNAGRGLVNALVDLGVSATGVHDITVQRCYFHQKEIGTNYNRSAMRAVWAEGRNITLKWSYVFLIGYYYPENAGASNYQMDTCSFISVGGPGPFSVYDNYISVWWNAIFLGGGDTAPAHTATLTGSSTTGATFSSTTSLSPGLYVRFAFTGTGTWDNSTNILTHTSGVALNSGDVQSTQGRSAIILSDGGSHTSINTLLGAVSGSNYTITGNVGSVGPSGARTYTVYQTARIDSVVGNTVKYTPIGVDSLRHAPSAAAWCAGDEGLINDVTLQKNTFEENIAFANDVYAKKGYGPKGYIEIKNANRLLIDGNYWTGYGSDLAIVATNQNGTAPWITTSNITVTNNWLDNIVNHCNVITVSENSYVNTVTPTQHVAVRNNLALEFTSFAYAKAGNDFSFEHNTVLNDAPSMPASWHNAVISDAPTTNFVFKNNIVGYSNYGMNCTVDGVLKTCWPNGVFQNNVVVDFAGVGVSGAEWGRGGVLTTIKSRFSQIGFIDPAYDNYRLSVSSPYKAKATDGRDPGVDMDELLRALPKGKLSRSSSRSQ